MRYVLGIDQGGTKTHALVGDELGHILGAGCDMGSCHSVNGMEHAMQAVDGAVRMALETGVPLVPVFVTRNKTPFCPVEVRFGAPYTLAREPDADHARCQQLADDALRKIYELGGDSYADQIGQNSGLLLRS